MELQTASALNQLDYQPVPGSRSLQTSEKGGRAVEKPKTKKRKTGGRGGGVFERSQESL